MWAHITTDGAVDQLQDAAPTMARDSKGRDVSLPPDPPAALLAGYGWHPVLDRYPDGHTTPDGLSPGDVTIEAGQPVRHWQPDTIAEARRLRDQRSDAVAAPTAQLLDTVTDRLAALRAGETPTSQDWIVIYEGLRQLGLKGVADEAIDRRSAAYAEIYTARVQS